MRISSLKVLCSSVKPAARCDLRPTVAYTIKYYHTAESGNVQRFHQNSSEMLGFGSATSYQYSRGSHYDSTFLNRGNSGFRGSRSFSGIHPLITHRFFSSASVGKGSISQGAEIVADSGANGASISNSGVGRDDWIQKFKDVWESTVEAAKYSGDKVKETSNEMAPHIQQWFDSHPYIRDVIIPIGGTLAGILLAWSLLPWFFRRFHKYSIEGPGALFSRDSLWGPVPYEQSFWGALEIPSRYFFTFMALLEIAEMVAPNSIASQYSTQACRGALVVSLIWFLHRWKTNVIARALSNKSIQGVRRDQLLALDKFSSVGLLVVGLMALAEAFGVAVQSVLTVGGIGGVATAFAARDVLGNILSGLSVQISQPFSLGDTIKAGSVEGQVVEMGLMTTSLLTAEKFPVIVPNSLFSSQVIVNKSRAKWRSMVKTIPLQIDDIDKISQISEDIKTVLKSNSNVFLEKEAPYCFLSKIERLYAELTFGCNLKQVSKEAEQDILLEVVRIIKQNGAVLGSTREDNIS